MRFLAVFSFLALALIQSPMGCTPAPTPYPGGTPTPTALPYPTVAAANGYRPLQNGDVIQDIQVQSYQVVLSLQEPIVTFGYGPGIPHIVEVIEQGAPGLADFIAETMDKAKGPDGKVSILGFDIDALYEKNPKPIQIDPSKPVEFFFGVMPTQTTYTWSDTEGPSGAVLEGYKLIRRKDGGLLFYDVYALSSLLEQTQYPTLNGGYIGLTFSSRVAALPFILGDPVYQKGKDAIQNHPFDFKKFDPRVVLIDPSKEGMLGIRQWVLFSKPNPALPPMRIAPN